MSGLFCFDPKLRILEKQMQQPPGYRPRGHGLSVLDEMDWNCRDDYSRIVDYVISRIHMEHLKQRVDEVFQGIEKEMIFLNMKHRKDFFSILLGRKETILRHTSNYGAAIFLLSADEDLWMKVSGCVLDTGIYFDRVKLGSVSLEQYILFHAAKKDGKVYAVVQHKLPFTVKAEADAAKAQLTEDDLFVYVSGDKFSYTFSKKYGVFTSLVVDGEEQLGGRTQLSAFRAPIDNERGIKQYWLNLNVWEGENLDCAFTKVYDCKIEDGEIVVEGSLAGISRLPLFKYTLKVAVFEDGKVDFKLSGDIRKDAHWLQRLGYTFELPQRSNAFSYYGRGPIECYCDMCHWATVGMYDSTAEKEMEIQVSEYTAHDLYKATHTDELKKDGKIHVRIDYKNSGVGSNSCGPALPEKYRLSEKTIEFGFSVKPVK